MRLVCESCAVPFQAGDIDRTLGIATCHNCRAVLDLRGRGSVTPAAAPPDERARVPLPSRFRVHEEPGLLRIRWRWFQLTTVFLLFFCVAWDSFLLFWYLIALAGEQVQWVMVLVPLAHVAAGVGLTYLAVAQLFNSSVVEVSLNHLRVRHGPLPWLGNVNLGASDIAQIFCEEQRSRTRQGGTRVRYQVNAIVRGNKTLKLVGGLEEKQQALFLEQEIERHLRIADAQVPGEVPRAGRSTAA